MSADWRYQKGHNKHNFISLVRAKNRLQHAVAGHQLGKDSFESIITILSLYVSEVYFSLCSILFIFCLKKNMITFFFFTSRWLVAHHEMIQKRMKMILIYIYYLPHLFTYIHILNSFVWLIFICVFIYVFIHTWFHSIVLYTFIQSFILILC